MKIIIDTNIYISAFCFDNLPDKLIQLVENSDDYSIITSIQIFKELEQKFLSGRLEKILKNKYIKSYCQLFLRGLSEKAITVEVPKSANLKICRDPNDDMLLSLANFGDVDYIITGDKDLLILETLEAKSKKIIKIVTVNQFLTMIQAWI